MAPSPQLRIATAGWAMPAASPPDAFARREPGLARYARQLDAVEVNSSFHRHHRPSTWQKWAQLVPDDFRFAVKVPKATTHQHRLALPHALGPLDQLLAEMGGIAGHAGPLLVQLPPSLEFDARSVNAFFAALRERWPGDVACEPRHPSWFQPEPDRLLASQRVARVAADPARVPEAAVPGGWRELAYVRLHGSPRTYYSAYGDERVAEVDELLRAAAAAGATRIWCVFDNTASGAAFHDAMRLQRLRAPSASTA